MGVFQYEKVKDPTYYGENRVAAHSDHRYYGSVEEMEQHVENFRHSLNGLWKFHYAKNYESTIPGFETPEYDCTKWDDIRCQRRDSIISPLVSHYLPFLPPYLLLFLSLSPV